MGLRLKKKHRIIINTAKNEPGTEHMVSGPKTVTYKWIEIYTATRMEDRVLRRAARAPSDPQEPPSNR